MQTYFRSKFKHLTHSQKQGSETAHQKQVPTSFLSLTGKEPKTLNGEIPNLPKVQNHPSLQYCIRLSCIGIFDLKRVDYSVLHVH